MKNPNDFWEQRYSENDFAYGEIPNQFFQAQLEKLFPGRLLLPAEGEGRNAVWAAKQGWEITAFDKAAAGREKALQLALKHEVEIDYRISGAMEFSSSRKFDAIALIYAHFPAVIRPSVHRKLLNFLKPGGKIIFEAFSKEQLQYASGGPKDEQMLFSEKEIRQEFPELIFEYLAQEEINLAEGKYHQGKGSVIRFIGIYDQV